MLYKEDWPEAERRLTALWHHERLDRPCIAVRAPLPTVDDDIAETQPADDEARYLDPAFVVPRALRRLKSTWWGGEALPGTLMLAGWVNCLGGTPHFAADTIWFDIVPVDFSQPSPFRHDPDSPWTKKYLLLLDAMLQAAGRDNFSVMVSAGLPANDIISMLMGTEEFLFAMLDQIGRAHV